MSTVIAIRALRLPDMAGAAQLLLAACPHRADAPRSLTGNGHRAQRSHWSAFLPQAGNLVAYASLWRVSRDKFRFDRSSIRRAVTAFEILLTDAHGRGGGDVLRWKLPVPDPFRHNHVQIRALVHAGAANRASAGRGRASSSSSNRRRAVRRRSSFSAVSAPHAGWLGGGVFGMPQTC
jgi:hypothetical protein